MYRSDSRQLYAFQQSDIIIVPDEDEMRSMIWRLEGYLERKGLVLNVEKTKIVRFRKSRARMKK